MAGFTEKRARGKGKVETEKGTGEVRNDWWLHVQLGAWLRALEEEGERLADQGRTEDHATVVKETRVVWELFNYEMRNRAALLPVMRKEGIEDDEELVLDFLKYQLKKHKAGFNPEGYHVPGPTSRSSDSVPTVPLPGDHAFGDA